MPRKRKRVSKDDELDVNLSDEEEAVTWYLTNEVFGVAEKESSARARKRRYLGNLINEIYMTLCF